MEQFLYKLKLRSDLLVPENWTAEEERIVTEHFEGLQELLKEKKLILAGKTNDMDEKTFGIVIFQAESESEAKEIMDGDPVVKKGVMTAELFPYRVALFQTGFEV